MQNAAGQCMLNGGIFEIITAALSHALSQSGVEGLHISQKNKTENVAAFCWHYHRSKFPPHPELQEEVFGPFTLIVTYKNGDELIQLAQSMKGQLTTTIFGETHELAYQRNLVHELNQFAGRLIINGCANQAWRFVMPCSTEALTPQQPMGVLPLSARRPSSVLYGLFVIKNFMEELLPAALAGRQPARDMAEGGWGFWGNKKLVGQRPTSFLFGFLREHGHRTQSRTNKVAPTFSWRMLCIPPTESWRYFALYLPGQSPPT